MVNWKDATLIAEQYCNILPASFLPFFANFRMGQWGVAKVTHFVRECFCQSFYSTIQFRVEADAKL